MSTTEKQALTPIDKATPALMQVFMPCTAVWIQSLP